MHNLKYINMKLNCILHVKKCYKKDPQINNL